MSGYPDTLFYFMWPFQVHYNISCQTKSEGVFNHLDRGLLPHVFLLGFLNNSESDKPRICYEPETKEFLEDNLLDLSEVAEKIKKNHPNKNTIYSGPGVQEEMNERLDNESFRLAIEEKLNSADPNTDNIFFVSNSVVVNDYSVHIVLSLNKLVYLSHTHLKTDLFQERFKVDKSLLETTVRLFLKDCEMNLFLPNPGKSLSDYMKSPEEILRNSARHFMYTISSKGQAFRGLHGLFDACNSISIHKYEGKENLGKIFITEKSNPQIEYTLELEEPFLLQDFRKSRKMLQLSNEEIGLICNTHEVLGLGKIKPTYDESSESIFEINFKGVHCWEVSHNKKQILIMKYGLPQFPYETINKKEFFSTCNRLFKNINQVQIDNLYKLSVAATAQKNGALLVVSANAKREADRLSKQSIAIKPITLDTEMLMSLTSIDGGVIVDCDGIAYAQGVILDGVVGYNGDSARGSRYNSAITYYDFKGKDTSTLIIVVSEDGMVDIIPKLKPQISRLEIKKRMEILEELKTNFDRGVFNSVMTWFESRQFYLSSEQCDIINSIKQELDDGNFDMVKIIYDDLKPNQEMNDSYFLD